jgi:hypothetical protein
MKTKNYFLALILGCSTLGCMSTKASLQKDKQTMLEQLRTGKITTCQYGEYIQTSDKLEQMNKKLLK